MAVQNIPPIQCLLTFEALARTRHAGRVADELNVTPSAISHRIRQLETHVGFKLFGRSDFTLTADGVAYLAQVRVGLAALTQLPSRRSGRSTARVRVAITPTFCRQLVMPRLELFRNAFPDIELIFQVSIPLLDVTAEESDLEIRFGTGGYSDLEHRPILEDMVTPVCSPSYRHEFGPMGNFAAGADIMRARLIRTPLEPWAPWFSSCGIDAPEPSTGGQFNDLGLAYDAAASGFGVTLLRQKLGAAWLDSGRLLRLSPRAVPSAYRHYICWQPGALDRWECAAFSDWLINILP